MMPPAARCGDQKALPRLAALVLLTGALLVGSAVTAAAETAPDYAATMLDDGGELALVDLRPQVVLLNGWATWCAPCREEMPFLEQLHRDYSSRGLRVVGVSLDAGGADDRVRAFVAELGVTFAVLRDPGNRFAETFRTRGVPETLLIARDGTIVHHWRGPVDTNEAETVRLVEAALDAAGAPDVGGLTGTAAQISYPVAFGAGLLSFLSPCFLPLVPTYAAIFTGLGLAELRDPDARSRARARRAVLRGGGAFVAGFGLVFVLLGASATLAGEILYDYRGWIARIGGAVLLVMGLHLLGVLRLPFLDRDLRLHAARRPTGVLGTFAVGLAFGCGWTPCIGPVLGSILVVAAASASVAEGMALLAVYAAGLAVPFLLASLALDRFMRVSRSRGRWLPWVERASGALVIGMAVLLLTGSLARLVAALA
jgi:cytochrome c-type biogenesis protein